MILWVDNVDFTGAKGYGLGHLHDISGSQYPNGIRGLVLWVASSFIHTS